MTRPLALLAGVSVAVLCALRFYRHDPGREVTAAGFVYRCKNCGASAATALELLDRAESGHVHTERTDQRARLHPGRVA